jgi:hypothetical protein
MTEHICVHVTTTAEAVDHLITSVHDGNSREGSKADNSWQKQAYLYSHPH